MAIPNGDGGYAYYTFDFGNLNRPMTFMALCVNVDHEHVGELVMTLKHESTQTQVDIVRHVGNPDGAGNCTGAGQGLYVLFDDLEEKEQLIGLLDDVRAAEGVRIFIGAETRLFSLSGSAVIAAPYMTGRQKVMGAIGVIGPARLNYARIIPLVDYTARVLGRMLDG